MDCFIFNNESINRTKDAVIIEGPDAVLNSSEENSPIITDNLFKSLALFLDTKNELPVKEIQTANHEINHTSTVDTLRTQKESERADEAMDRFTKKLREENAKRKKNRKVAS